MRYGRLRMVLHLIVKRLKEDNSKLKLKLKIKIKRDSNLRK
jgi:hypothetical protein